MQQIDHRPQVTALFDVHLKQVAQVVQRRRGVAEQALLLDGGGLGVALRDDDAAEHVAELARHLVPHRLARRSRRSRSSCRPRGGVEKDAPAIIGHLHVIEVRPAVGIDRYRRAQINIFFLISLGADLLPPIEIVGQPLLERALQPLVRREVDVVRDLVVHQLTRPRPPPNSSLLSTDPHTPPPAPSTPTYSTNSSTTPSRRRLTFHVLLQSSWAVPVFRRASAPR